MDKLIQEISIDKGFIKETLEVLREALLRAKGGGYGLCG